MVTILQNLAHDRYMLGHIPFGVSRFRKTMFDTCT